MLLAGCVITPKTAIVNGREVPRPTLEFFGQPYTIKHEGAHPQPGGPSSGLSVAGGGIRGRVDDMKIVRGTNVYPRAVEAIVRDFAEVDEFQVHLYTADGIRDEIEVLVELPDPSADEAAHWGNQ